LTADTRDPGYKLSFVIPVRNEAISAGIMVRMLDALVDIAHETLIVYDFPEDDTVPAVKALQPTHPHLRLVYNARGRGVANAIRAGIEAADGEYVVIMPCDDIGPVFAVSEMTALAEKGCDLVAGTRYAHGGRRLGGSRIEASLSGLGNKLLNLLTGSSLTDATTGLKMLRRSAFPQLALESQPVGWAVAFEIALKAQAAGWKLGEVPIISVDRLFGGQSTFRVGPWFREYLKWFFWGVRQAFRKGKRWKVPVQVMLPQNLAIEKRRIHNAHTFHRQ
jgi:dolichol-phosphate mannosyltransferase